MPHGHCYLWTPAMVWAQVASNGLIGLAYFSISATLVLLVQKVKLPFSWVYIAFGLFILACGMTHFMEVVTMWHPIYWVDAGLRVLTAAASIGTAVLILPLVPKALALAEVSGLARERGEQLAISVEELVAANDLLLREQAERARLAAENATLVERARTHEFQERFLAVLGHDLKNPLAAIGMGAALLRQQHADEGDQKVLKRIDKSATRMTRMIDQILDLTRSRLGGGMEMNVRDIELNPVLAQVVDELQGAYPKSSVIFECPPHSVRGAWDPDRLGQVFSNLVGNAIQHGLEGSAVVVSIHDKHFEVVVTVHNEGTPIPQELLAKLFDPFRRGARESRTSRTAGLGLGLYISREIVLAHGGSIKAASTVEGTTFRVSLPLPAAAALS